MSKIFIDPGHGGSDPGAVENGVKEKDLVLDISLRLKDQLQRYNDVEVMMSRDDDSYVSLSDRATMANDWGADYFVSVHVNAGGGTGIETYRWNGNVSDATVSNQNVMHGELIAATGATDRGKKTANFAVLRETSMPAILTENMFIDSADARKLKDDKFITRIVDGHVKGLKKIFGLSGGSSSGSSKSTTTASSTSFTDLSNSEKYKEIEKAVDDVAVLQRQLMAVGEDLSRYGDDGVAGAETLNAIQSFQRKHNISNPAGDNYGRPGPSTQAKLDDLITYTRLLRNQSPMMRGEDVRQVQRVVGTDVDSVYGPNTASAVEGYQRKHNLVVDGIVGPETFGHMFG